MDASRRATPRRHAGAVRPALRVRHGAALALLAALLLVACTPPTHDGEITSATPVGDVFAPRLEVEPEHTFIERFDPPGAGAGLALALATVVRNPNSFPIVLDRIDYRLLIADEVVAESHFDAALALGANGSAALAWTLAGDLGEQRTLWSQVVGAFAGVPLPFAVEGRLVFSSQSYAFTTGTRRLVEGTVLSRESVRAPRIRLESAGSRVMLLHANAPVVALTLLAQNPGDVGYFLTGRGLRLELNDVQIAELDLGPLPLPAGDIVRTELSFVIDRSRLDERAAEALEEALAGRRGDVRVLGDFAYDVLGVDSFPVVVTDGLVLRLPARALPRQAPPGPSDAGYDDDEATDSATEPDDAPDDAPDED